VLIGKLAQWGKQTCGNRALSWREEVLERLCRRVLDQPGGRGVCLRDHSQFKNGLSAILPDAVLGGMTQHHQGGPSGNGNPAASGPLKKSSGADLIGSGSKSGSTYTSSGGFLMGDHAPSFSSCWWDLQQRRSETYVI
jgi:hypothetical protein